MAGSTQDAAEVTELLGAFHAFLVASGYNICEEDGTGYASTIEPDKIYALITQFAATTG